jgi:aspartate/methionine/tyrosine aminotransferase
MNLSQKMSLLGTESAFDVLVKARALEAQGRDIIHLEIGEPDFDTPEHIVEAAKKALDDGFTHYGPAAGLPELREAIAADVAKSRNIDVHPDQIVVTPGAKPIMFYTILAYGEPGAEIIYPNPGFPIYESVIKFSGATPVAAPLLEDKDFSLDIDEFRSLVNDSTRLIIINSPQNPTGGFIPPEDLAAIAEVAVARGIPILADEIYSRMLYDDPFSSISAYDGVNENLIILDGLSKTYAMTGWRIGYGVMPKELATHTARLMVNSNSCTAAFTQMAAIAAITGPQDASDAMIAEFKKRRDVFQASLDQIEGFTCRVPKGAFYLFPNVSDVGKPSQEIENILLEDAGVASLSGTGFGRYGEGYLRFSYANSLENLEAAAARIAACEKLRT